MDQPQFATVSFVSEQDSSLNSTLRVPISREMSVRHLAKDAMQRLVLSRCSGTAGYKDFPAISVSEVRVGGLEPHHAEIFARDLVTQVVLVKEEVVFLKLQLTPRRLDGGARHTPAGNNSASTGHADRPAPAAPNPAGGPGTSASAAPTRASSPVVEPPQPQLQCPLLVPVAAPRPILAEKSINVAGAQEVKDPRPSAKRPRDDDSRVSRSEPRTKEASGKAAEPEAAAESRPAGWGPEASNYFPDNYCSSPDKLARRVKATAKRLAQPSQQKPRAAAKKSAEGKPSALPSKNQDPKAEEPTDSAARPPGWGPEAYKSFPSNYVASPDRLAREIRKQQREEERRRKAADGGAAPTVATVPASRPKRIARQLEYEEEVQRSTVGHRVDAAVVVEDESPENGEATDNGKATAPLPKGWGSEASKYFDPDTYCDDPRKAKVNIADCPRSVRPHRTPPSALFK